MEKFIFSLITLFTISAFINPIPIAGVNPEEEEVFQNIPYTEIKTIRGEEVVKTIEDIENCRKNEVSPQTSPEDKVFSAVEQPAEFPGGQVAMMNWISENIRYPESGRQNCISGRVVLRFVVERDGSITKPSIVKGIDRDFDREAIRVVEMMPKWQPGKINGQPVRSYYLIPVKFSLPADQ